MLFSSRTSHTCRPCKGKGTILCKEVRNAGLLTFGLALIYESPKVICKRCHGSGRITLNISARR